MSLTVSTNSYFPLGMGNPYPEFAWKLDSNPSNHGVQTAYEIQVSIAPDFEHMSLVWNEGKIKSAEQFGITYNGDPLESRTQYYWRVRVWDSSDSPSKWSKIATFETGIMDPNLWTAKWISAKPLFDPKQDKVLYFHKFITASSAVVNGRAYVSALGWYRLFINDVDITGPCLVPRWTPTDHTLEYQTYDISQHFHVGRNRITIVVGDGRYRGRLGVATRRCVYGDSLAAFAQFHLQLEGIGELVSTTNESWVVSEGPIQRSDPRDGEVVDLRVNSSESSLVNSFPVRMITPPAAKIIAEEVPRVQEVDRLVPIDIKRTPSGKQLIDFGQNFAGVARIRLSGPAGTKVKLEFSEIVGLNGELDLKYVFMGFPGSLEQKDEIILSGKETWFQPFFTIHGFRYVTVDGLPATLGPTDIQGIVLSSKLPTAGTFECSNPQLEKLWKNVFWSLLSNFVDTPTDCPTRERSGWTDDIQIFGPAATHLVASQEYLRRYLSNVEYEQFDDGTIPPVIPSETSKFSGSNTLSRARTSVGWGDVSVMLPWTLYRYYGDKAVLEKQYDSMRLWVDQMELRARTKRSWKGMVSSVYGDHILDTGFHWGEWLRPDEGVMSIILTVLLPPSAVVATAYYANSTRILSEISAIIGKKEDSLRYQAAFTKIRSAWQAAFVQIRKDGIRIGSDKQDDYVRALEFDLLLPEHRPKAVDRLVQLIEKENYHLATGFLSTPMLLPALTANGRPDVAFKLLLQKTCPSWLYQIERGATTIWETWPGYDKRGNASASHNHYAFGSIITWLHEGIAGISPLEPGYRVILIKPTIGGGITHAKASLETPFGLAISSWKIINSGDGEKVDLTITIPIGASAVVHHGTDITEGVPAGTHFYTWRLK
ncbi:hypothetical protein TWF481_003656 [Arthrobotrys musiformis]|uniref:alpha-L-rhamnosidase n=1 Tax=Arthrobotrys musiformis TaxID=47236 RepID=A0AAV9WIH9_9PEZI